MFRATNPPILRSTFWLYIQLLVQCTDIAAGRQQYRCIAPKAVYIVKKCSWGWAGLSPETCRADLKRSINGICCILLVAYNLFGSLVDVITVFDCISLPLFTVFNIILLQKVQFGLRFLFWYMCHQFFYFLCVKIFWFENSPVLGKAPFTESSVPEKRSSQHHRCDGVRSFIYFRC